MLTFTCAVCHQVLESELSEEAAEEQFKKEFPFDKRDKENDLIVCDDCFQANVDNLYKNN